MASGHGKSSSVVEPNELLFRRIPVSKEWYNAESNEVLAQAFSPRRDDKEGLSVTRAKSQHHSEFLTIEEAARGMSSKGYYIATLLVADIRSHDMSVIPDPIIPDNPGHAIIPDINYDNRKTDRAMILMETLAQQLVIRVDGPFHVAAD